MRALWAGLTGGTLVFQLAACTQQSPADGADASSGWDARASTGDAGRLRPLDAGRDSTSGGKNADSAVPHGGDGGHPVADSSIDSGSGPSTPDSSSPPDANSGPPSPPPPTLADLFAGTAQFQQDSQALVIGLTFGATQPTWDQKKLSILQNPADDEYYAFTRKVTNNSMGVSTFNIALLKSTDGAQTFTEVAELFQLGPGLAVYDAHVSINANVSPPEAVLLMECNAITASDYGPATGLEWASTCISTSTTPFDPTSWSYPTVLVSGCDSDPTTGCTDSIPHSASTPVGLFDGANEWVAWTGVEDNGNSSYADSEGSAWPSGTEYANTGTVLMGADHDTHCTSYWDCNNRDKQDWYTDGPFFYLIYNGANYYRCQRPTGDTGGNQWGVTIARSTTGALGMYSQLPSPIVLGQDGYCNTAYPTLLKIGGVTFLYYVNGPTGGPYPTKRIQLQWTSANPLLTCGELGGALCDNGSGVCSGQGEQSSDCTLCCGGSVP